MARLVVPGYPHHVTQRGGRRQTTFFDDGDYRAYLNLLTELKRNAGVDIWAYCLMPNHVHFVAVPNLESSLAELFGPLHKRYADKVNAAHEWTGHLWQERFRSVVMDETHLLAAVRYIEMNPVRAGLCGRPEDWAWSSTSSRLSGVADGVLTLAPLSERISDWRAYLAAGSETAMLDTLRQRTRSGLPAGDSKFVDRLEATTGRRLRKPRVGRPAGKSKVGDQG